MMILRTRNEIREYCKKRYYPGICEIAIIEYIKHSGFEKAIKYIQENDKLEKTVSELTREVAALQKVIADQNRQCVKLYNRSPMMSPRLFHSSLDALDGPSEALDKRRTSAYKQLDLSFLQSDNVLY